MRICHLHHNPIAGILGILVLLLMPTAGLAGEKADPRAVLLDEWSHDDAVPASVYRELLGNRTERAVRDKLLVQVASQEWVVIKADDIADAGDILHDFDHQLSAFGHQLTEAQRRQIVDYAGRPNSSARNALVGRMFGPLAAVAADFGLRMLNLSDGTGGCKFAVVSQKTYRHWLGFKFSDQLKVEDASVQFAAQLIGTPYERYLATGLRPVSH
jgi:hypothetical protein